jgi:hypothetical protein
MNPITRLFMAVRGGMSRADQVESYYSAVIRRQPNGGPTYAETRRDMEQAQQATGRYGMI